jgi:hypothetical protein
MKNAELVKIAKQVLNKEEMMLFELMNTQYLVPFIKGPAGIGKTQSLETIANKLNMEYIDLRLPAVDDVDMGLYPVVNRKEVGSIQVNKLEHAAPEWAVMPIENPKKNYMIVFEELNRANPSVRNAAMGVVLERRVGWNIKFGNNVFMAATGNLGDKDGTEVEELDFAQKDRFIIIEKKPDLHEWINNFAKNKVHPDIINYLEHKPGQFYPPQEEQKDECVLTPRKWTGFSDYIIANTESGINSKVEEYQELLERGGLYYLGGRFAEFRKFVLEGRTLTVQDVLKGNRTKDYPMINRDNKAEVLRELRGLDFHKLKTKECDNLKDFMNHFKETDHDMLVSFIFDAGDQFARLTDKTYTAADRAEILGVPFIKMLWTNFKVEWDYVDKNNKHERKVA